MSEYPIEMIIIEAVEAIAIVILVIMIIKLWREVMVPG